MALTMNATPKTTQTATINLKDLSLLLTIALYTLNGFPMSRKTKLSLLTQCLRIQREVGAQLPQAGEGRP